MIDSFAVFFYILKLYLVKRRCKECMLKWNLLTLRELVNVLYCRIKL